MTKKVTKKLYVGNLSYDLNDNELKGLFEQHGKVESAQVILDRDTGRSKGFGFVEMSNEQEAKTAISAFDGKEVNGRVLKVNEAKPYSKDRNYKVGSGHRSGGFGGGKRY